MDTFKMIEKIKRIISHNGWKMYEIQFSMSIDKVFLEYSHIHSLKYSLRLPSHCNSKVTMI